MSGNKRGLRFLAVQLAEAQNWHCAYCGCIMTDDPNGAQGRTSLTIDHIIPRSRGGHYSYINCVAACFPCNHERGAIDAFLFYGVKRTTRQLTKYQRKELMVRTNARSPKFSSPHQSKNQPLKRLYYITHGGLKTWEDLNPNLREDRP